MKTIIRKTKPIVFKNKDFQTIQIKVFFPFKREEKNIAYMSLLPGMLHHVDAKYPTEREFSLEMQKLFILYCFCSTSTIIQDSYICFQMMIPDVISLKEDLLEKQFEFFFNMIYHPKLDGEQFCSEELKREIDNLKVDIEKAYKDPSHFAAIRLRQIIDPDSEYSQTIYNHQDQIDAVTTQNLYQFYLDIVSHNQPFIYIFGNVDSKRMEDLCNQFLYLNPISEKEFMVQTNRYLPTFSKLKDVTEKSDFQNSIYMTVYKVKDMKEEDEILLSAVKTLLSSQSSRLLSKTLRIENDLVYHTYATSSNHYGLLGITAFIHKDHYKEVQEKILDVLNQLKDESIIAPCLDTIKERSRISLIWQLDDKTVLFDNDIIKDLGIDLTNEEYHEKLMKVTPQDIIAFMDRLVLDTKYFLEEGDHA